jgi:hypothetical protein
MVRLKEYSRFELKYLISEAQRQELAVLLENYMQPDPQGDEMGRYNITSLYYDTPDYCIGQQHVALLLDADQRRFSGFNPFISVYPRKSASNNFSVTAICL